MDFEEATVVAEGLLKLIPDDQIHFNRALCKIYEFILGRHRYTSIIVLKIWGGGMKENGALQIVNERK